VDDIGELMRLLERPLPLPAGLRSSLASVLTGEQVSVPDRLEGLDSPLALPGALRDRLAAALTTGADVPPVPARSRGLGWQRWMAVAAAIVLLAGMVNVDRLQRAAPRQRRCNRHHRAVPIKASGIRWCGNPTLADAARGGGCRASPSGTGADGSAGAGGSAAGGETSAPASRIGTRPRREQTQRSPSSVSRPYA
jgi:hypothetical protein